MTSSERAIAAAAAPFLLAGIPVASAVVRAVRTGWLPMGDNAYFTIRAGDVLGPHHPLVGAWSSGSTVVGVDVNNLGPLQLDLLAAPVRLLGPGPGTAVGVGMVNLVAVLAVVAAGRARGGRLGAWVAALAATALAWAMGSELLIEPRQPHPLVLAVAAVLAGVWCLVAGDRRALPWTVFGASLLVQTHLSYVVPVVVLGLASAAAVVVLWRSSDAPERRAVHRTLLLSLVVLVVVWAQPLVDQLVGDRNVSAVLDAGQAEQASMGLVDGARAVATVVGPPTAWLRPAFLDFDPAGGLVGAPAAGATLTVVAVAVAAIARRARRLGHGGLQAAAVTVGLALLAAWAGAARTPTGGSFGTVAGNFRFLWPVAVATWALGLAAVVAALPSAPRRWASLGLAAATTAVALASIPLSYQSPAPADDAPLRPTAQALLDGLDALEGRGPFLVDRSGLFFGEPYSYVLLLGLQERGVGFSLVATTDLSRFGDGRRPDGGEEGTLRLRTGAGAGDPPAGTELVLLVNPLTKPEARELSALDARRAAGGLRPGSEDRYEALRTRRDRGTLALWLEPAGSSPGPGNRAAVTTSTGSGP